jgi:uncharacterized membrane protein YphA (DoxX/SURF4 family)
MDKSVLRNKAVPALLAFLRIVIGWHFLYEGLIKVLDPNWSARSFLEGSRWVFGDLFRFMAGNDTILQAVDIANGFGLTLVGLALITGLFTRLASWAGITMLFLYYLAYPPFGGYSYGAGAEGNYLIVNKNLIELVCLLLIAFTRSGEFFGLDKLVYANERKEDRDHNAIVNPEPSAINKRRELLKGLAGLPFLAGFSGVFLKNMPGRGPDAISSATLPRVTYKRLADLKGELPRGHLGNLELSRLILGCNLISGYAHARDLIYANTLFKAYNTDEKILETFHLAEMAGINTCFITTPNFPIYNKYMKLYGGKMQTVCQADLKATDFFGDIYKAIDSGATTLYIQGGYADRYVRDGKISQVATAVEYIKKKGFLAGVGCHALEVIQQCEKEGVPTDYYVKTFHHDKYWSAHPVSQREPFSVDIKKSVDHNMIHDNIFDLFPDKTTQLMSGISKPWIAFKVLAGGAIAPKNGFRFAFENGADFICVGMFDFQIVDDINTVCEVLAQLKSRQRPWFS